MKNSHLAARVLVSLLAVFQFVAAAQAAEYSIGGGIGLAPDYEGSSDYVPVPVPAGSIAFDNGMFAKMLGLNLRANLITAVLVVFKF